MIISNKMRIRAMKIVLTLNNTLSPIFSNIQNTKIIYSCALPGYLQAHADINRLAGYTASTANINIYGGNLQDDFQFTKYNIGDIGIPLNLVQIFAGYLDDLTPQPDGTYSDTDVKALMDYLPIVWLGNVVDAGIVLDDVDRPLRITSIMFAQTLNRMRPSSNAEQSVMSDIAKGIIKDANDIANGQFNTQQPGTINYNLLKVVPERSLTDYTDVGNLSPMQYLNQLAQDYGYQLIINVNPINPQIYDVSLIDINLAPTDQPAEELGTDTGMIGYPQVVAKGITLKEYFNPYRRINDSIILKTYNQPLDGLKLWVWQYSASISTHDDMWETELLVYGYGNPSVSGALDNGNQ